MDKTPLYNPVDKSKARKPRADHPWGKWQPGYLSSRGRGTVPPRKSK